jgi:putative tricarboxylic transport membrane protein
MGPPEITAVIILALTIIAAVSGKSLLKGLIAAALGIFINCVGLDPVTATSRLCMGSVELQNGIPLMAIGIGMLALSEVLVQIEEHTLTSRKAISFGKDAKREDRIVSFPEFKANLKTILRSSLIGTGVGALPGLGTTIAAFLGYGAAKRASKTPEQFGKGALEGVAAAEAANNAVVGANLIPLFTLGIPGNVAAAILIGAFMIHGVTPGPLMFQEHGRLIYGIYGALLIANGLNLTIGNFGLRFFAKVMRTPKQIIYPVITICCVTGAYMADNSLFAVGLMIIFAILGYFMKKLDFSFVTFIIGFVLGPILELSLRQTLVISKNNPMILLERPVSLIFLILTILSIWMLGFRSKRGKIS